MWASFFETIFTFWVYDEFKDLARVFVDVYGFHNGLVKYFNGFLAASMGLGVGIMHDIYLRRLVEFPID